MVFVPSVPHCPLKEAGQRPEQAEDTGQGSPTQAVWKHRRTISTQRYRTELGFFLILLGLYWCFGVQAGFRALGTKAGVKPGTLVEIVLCLLPDFASLCWTSKELVAHGRPEFSETTSPLQAAASASLN